MRKTALLLSILLLLAMPCAHALERDPVLDIALSMLEEGNPFLAQYNRMTGADIAPRFPLGCPYFFGGSNYDAIGNGIKAWQSSTYYKKDLTYVGGFDCAGFTKWVMKQDGRGQHPSISALLNRSISGELYIPVTYGVPAEYVSQYLIPGDLLCIQHASGGYHIMMYIGTLRSFGWTRDTVPQKLQRLMDYPLMIHCSSNEDYYERYQDYVRTYKPWALPTDGGVMVSLLDAPEDNVDDMMMNEDHSAHYVIKFEGYNLTLYSTATDHHLEWVRWSR